jgi:hemophore-related protein
MMTLSLKKLAAAVGGAALALSAAAGVASADPMDAVINTTCTYPQVIAALNATNPAAAAKFNSNPLAANMLQSFLNAPVPERQQKAQEMMASPYAAKYIGIIQQVAVVCNNY